MLKLPMKLKLSLIPTLIFFTVALNSGCGLHDRSTTPASSAKASQDRMFRSNNIEPQGNSALHYLDARLEKLQSRDPQALAAMRKAVTEDPNSPYLHAELSRHLAEADQFEQATLESDRALALAPGDPELFLLRGKLMAVKKNSREAIAAYDRCIEIKPDLEECHTMKSREYVMEKDYDTARSILKNYLVKNPIAVDTLFFLATLYTEKETEYPQAEKLLKRTLEEDSHHIKSLTTLAQIYLKQKKFDEALTALLTLEHIVPNDVAIKLRVGLLYYDKENYPEAIRRFSQVLELQPKNDRVHYYLGILEAQNDNHAKAVEYFSQVPPKSEYYRDARIRLAFSYGELNQLNQAIKVIRDALNNKRDEPDLYELLGTLYAKNHQYPQALKAFNAGLERFPNQEKLMFSKGVLLDKMDRFEDSVQIMKQILALYPDNPEALNYLGYSYADRNIHLDTALTMLQKAYQLRPKDGYIADSLAWAYFKLNHFEKARELLEAANRLSPNEPTILEHLGDLYLKLGQREKAKGFYQDAVAAAIKVKAPDSREQKDLARIQDKLAGLNP